MPLQTLNPITPEEVAGKLHVGQNDTPQLGTLGMQELFDAQPNLIRAKFNAAVTTLNSWISNILAKDNTTPYTPTADHHPATKKYADDIAHASGAVTPVDIANWNGKADLVYVDSQLSNKVTKQSYQSFSPSLVDSGGSGAFTYSTRLGEYKMVDDYIYYSFVIVVSNFTTSGASGTLSLSMPAPAASGFFVLVPIASFGTSSDDIATYAMAVTGGISYITPKGATSALDVSKITSANFAVRGQVFYRYK